MSAECRDIEKLNPLVKAKLLLLQDKCKAQNLKLGIGETYRSVERQDYLYAQGRTRPGAIVTHVRGSNMGSYHQWNLAFDVFQNVKGEAYNTAFLNRVGAMGAALGLEWGGNWVGFVDRPHFQCTFGLKINDLRAGKKPPTAIVNPVDTDLVKAVDRLIAKGLDIQRTAWNDIQRIQPMYVSALFSKIGARWAGTTDPAMVIKYLVDIKVISSPGVWLAGRYEVPYIRALLIKLEGLI